MSEESRVPVLKCPTTTTMERFGAILEDSIGFKGGESLSLGANEGNEWSRSRKTEEERTLSFHMPGTAPHAQQKLQPAEVITPGMALLPWAID